MNITTSIRSVVTNICTPMPHTYKTPLERQILLKRNENILLLVTINLLTVLSYISFVTVNLNKIQRCWVIFLTINIMVFGTTCRRYPNVFRLYLAGVLMLFGPLCYMYLPEAIFSNMVSVYVIPLWVLWLNDNKVFLFHTVVQIIYLRVLYKPQLLETLKTLEPEFIAQRIVETTTLCIITVTVFTLSTQYTLIKAQRQAQEEMSKKSELERQKIFLLSFSHEIRNLINATTGSIPAGHDGDFT